MIYGAQGTALAVYKAMVKGKLPIEFLGFLVTSLEENPSLLKNFPVYELESYASKLSTLDKELLQIWIATPDFVMNQIENELYKFNLQNIKRIDSITLAKLQENMFANDQYLLPLTEYEIKSINTESYLQIFQTKFYRDQRLKNNYPSYDYLYPLQVGASLTTERVTTLVDCFGEYISHKNGDYCELTGLYWIWQNVVLKDRNFQKKYYGLNHYRRIFELTSDDIEKIFSNNIDVILPFPLSYEPNMEIHHQRYLNNFEWQATLQALNEFYPNEMSNYQLILNQEYIFNYNIFIARGDIFDEYCSWLFPLLSRIEELINPDGTRLANRYIGYIAESLETIYFLSKKEKLKIACKGCRLLT